SLWGPKLSTEEVNKAKERAPLDKDGLLLCWGKFEALDPCVQMQLLRRGGLRRMRPETKESVGEKIKLLRAAVIKDRVSKVDRKSGQGEEENPAETRAGGDKAVQFSDVPEEFAAVDYTAAEVELQEAIRGPDDGWLQPPHGDHHCCVEAADGASAPNEVQELVAKAQALADGPVLGALREASDDLFAWAATRVALAPNATLEEILGDMATYGIGETAAEAGSSNGIHVTDVVWEPGLPGRAVATIEGASWTLWDYREEVHMSEELAGMLQQPEEGIEKRQCVTKAIAAGIMWRTLARQPTPEEVEAKSLDVRVEQTRQALEARSVMGEAAQKVAPIEAEIRVYTHDTLKDLEDCKLVVIRADYKGDVVVETVTGPLWRDNGWTLWTLIWRGHMVFLEPPATLQTEVFLDRWQPYDTPALGFLFFWHSRHDQEKTAPGLVQCRLCRGRKAGDLAVSLRRESNLAAAAIVGCIRAGSQPLVEKIIVRGDALCFQEVFAGVGVMTGGWAEAGIKVLSPVEVWSEPEARHGYRPDCDLTKGDVQKRLLCSAANGQANIWWIAPPCTSFCDWGAQNNGTRTFACPWGGANNKPHKEVELQGNLLSKVAAEIFLNVLRNGGFPVVESSGRSGRYSKMWDLPWWREILARPDVQFVEFPMCAFGLGPADGSGFYHHKTRVAFRRCDAFAKALSRCCPGVGAAHKHIPLGGARPGAARSRCAEAGVYPSEFVRTVVSTLQQVLFVSLPGGAHGTFGGGQDEPQWKEDARAGGASAAPYADVSGPSTLCGGRTGWLDELDDDLCDWWEGRDEDIEGRALGTPTRAWVLPPTPAEETRAGSAESYKAPSVVAKEAAQNYIKVTAKAGPGSPFAWKQVCDSGEDLVRKAGSVRLAAESLWQVREEENRNNLSGVEGNYLDTVLHPDLL
ncbi:unnamed protein product, partial [Symbiodinium sp. CCMP2456]